MRRSFRFWQWETLAVTMIGYALYYVIRKNLSIAMPLLGEIGVTKVQLGTFLTCGRIVYGVGRFLNGFVVDRNSSRKVMALGLAVCALINVAVGFSDSISGALGTARPTVALVWTMGILWIVNSYFQGMGAGPCIKTLPQWFSPKELSTKQSIWNLSHSIGAGAVFALCGWFLIPAFHSWRLCFIVPAAIALVGAAAILLLLKDSPSDLGFPSVLNASAKPFEAADKAAYKAYVRKHVFCNSRVWVLGFADFFVYIVRFAVLDWGIVLLMETKGLSLAQATTLCFVFEIVGGNCGMVVAGWATDRFFGSHAHRTSVFCMIGAALFIAAFWLLPASAPLAGKLVLFLMIGFFIYGPQALLGIAATQQATPRAAGVAGGFVGIFSYASTVLSGIGFGYIAQRWGWNMAYATILAAAFAGGAVLTLIWRDAVSDPVATLSA